MIPRRAGAAALAILALAGCNGDDPGDEGATSPPAGPAASTSTAGPAAEPPYTLAATRRCLVAEGAVVAKIDGEDAQLRALGDLAQRTSVAVRVDGSTVGLAFENAELLRGLLRSPGSPYRLEVRRNALLMFRPASSAATELVRGCLRA